MITRETDMNNLDLSSRSRGAGGVVATTILAAAVGAGVALLLAPEAGSETRRRLRRRIESFELGDKLRHAGESATEQWDDIQGEIERQIHGRQHHGSSTGRTAGVGLLTTLVGAGLALLLAPDSGAHTRERIGEQWRSFRNGSARTWKRRRGARAPSSAETFDPSEMANDLGT